MKKELTPQYDPQQVAEALGVSRRTVYRWLSDGELKGRQYGRSWRVTEQDLQEFAARSTGSHKRQPQPVQVAPTVPPPVQVAAQPVPAQKSHNAQRRADRAARKK